VDLYVDVNLTVFEFGCKALESDVSFYGRPAQIAIWLPGSLPDVRLFLFFLYCVYMFLSGK